MKVCIYGAGAIGGHLATRLIASGRAEVSVIARGPHLMAIRERGLVLRSDGRELSGRPVAATDDPAALPLQDIVVVTLKAYALASVARPVAALLAPNGVAVFAANGLPWWWNHGLGSGGALELLDTDGALWRGLGAQRVLGAVVNSANAVVEPGVIVNTGGGRRWTIGEPDSSRSERVQVIVDLLAAADIDSVLSTDIRRDIFRKLCVNISSNPLAALTRLTSRDGA
jgi:2-dehydropantoate 2-reductase